VRNGIASLAASVLSLFRSDVSATGQTVWLGGSAVEIVNGCTGIDVSIFLAAAMLVYPAAWRAKLRGVVLAFAVVLAANFLRVLILSWLNAGWPRAFELAHVYVLPALILVVCVATLLAWIRSATPRDA
jgi:exosortase/archaeosortase family protein